MPAKPLTQQQLNDAQRLKAAFRAWQARRAINHLPFSQDFCSEQLQFGQSAMNQYLNGKIPLNLAAATKFSRLIGVPIGHYSPALERELSQLVRGLPASAEGEAAWPFPEIDQKKLADLDQASRLRLEGAILAAARQLDLDIRKI